MPEWLTLAIGVPIALAVFVLWVKTMTGLWQQEQHRKTGRPATSAVGAPGTPTAPPRRSTADRVALIGAGLAIVALMTLGGADTNTIRQLAMFGVIVAVAAQQWWSRRKAKQAEARASFPDYQPYQDVR